VLIGRGKAHCFGGEIDRHQGGDTSAALGSSCGEEAGGLFGELFRKLEVGAVPGIRVDHSNNSTWFDCVFRGQYTLASKNGDDLPIPCRAGGIRLRWQDHSNHDFRRGTPMKKTQDAEKALDFLCRAGGRSWPLTAAPAWLGAAGIV
jgi:hypothetical protein